MYDFRDAMLIHLGHLTVSKNGMVYTTIRLQRASRGIKRDEIWCVPLLESDMFGEIGAATYSIEEAAKLLGIGRNACYEAARTGQVPTVRIGKRLLVPKIALNRLLQGLSGTGAHENH